MGTHLFLRCNCPDDLIFDRYRFDGLYTVVGVKKTTGKDGHVVCSFEFQVSTPSAIVSQLNLTSRSRSVCPTSLAFQGEPLCEANEAAILGLARAGIYYSISGTFYASKNMLSDHCFPSSLVTQDDRHDDEGFSVCAASSASPQHGWRRWLH